jgi:hypothetical protein
MIFVGCPSRQILQMCINHGDIITLSYHLKNRRPLNFPSCFPSKKETARHISLLHFSLNHHVSSFNLQIPNCCQEGCPLYQNHPTSHPVLGVVPELSIFHPNSPIKIYLHPEVPLQHRPVLFCLVKIQYI